MIIKEMRACATARDEMGDRLLAVVISAWADHFESLEAEITSLRRQRAVLSDKLNGTPCAEVRWNAEREGLIARAEAAERKLWRLEWEAEHGPLGILCGGEDNG